MKTWLNIFLVILISIGCASRAEKREPVLKAVRDGSLSSLQTLVGNQNLKGQSDFHNVLAASCHMEPYSSEAGSKALFLINRRALPVEEEIDDPNLQSTEYLKSLGWKSKGPLLSSMKNGCTELAQVYLNEMSAEDIAKSAKEYKGTDLSSYLKYRATKAYSDEEKLLELKFIRMQPDIYKTIQLVLDKNFELCKKHKENCQARDHLEKELAVERAAFAGKTLYNTCLAGNLMNYEHNLMQQQVEFGERTGVASPTTYDLHASQALNLSYEYNYYRQLYQDETNRKFDGKLCGQFR